MKQLLARLAPAKLAITTEKIDDQEILGVGYTLKLSSRRRSVAIEIVKGQVVVRAPTIIDQQYLQKFLQTRQPWVREKLDQQRQRQAEIPQRYYRSGEVFPYLGKDYRLDVSVGKENRITLIENVESARSIDVLLAPRSQLRMKLRDWYRRQAETILQEKTDNYAAMLGVRVSAINLRLTKRKWGHCTHDGRIQYNWHIILAPEAVVNYLVAHEVSHRVHLNHSADFWHTVEQLCPDFRNQRQWLKRYGHQLIL